MRKKGLLSLGLVLILLLALAMSGCSKKESDTVNSSSAEVAATGGTSAPTEAPNQDSIKLKMLHWVPFSEAVLDKFHEKYPNITVQVERVDTNNYNTVLKSRIAAKADIDIVGLHAGDIEFGFAVDNKAVMDLTGSGYLSNLMPAAISAATKDGKTYGFSQATFAWGAWYNKDMFAKAGITELPFRVRIHGRLRCFQAQCFLIRLTSRQELLTS
jgi:raffinose/stachyose/melibiose transport system substrate-binding protein